MVFKIVTAIILTLLPVSALAQDEVVQLPDIVLSPGSDVELIPVIDHDKVIVEPLYEDESVIVERLLEKAKERNQFRKDMRKATTLTETECLALALYHEARGEGERGIKAVAFVIYNRVKSELFPGSYCSVVLQNKQFSFISDHLPDNIKEWEVYEKVLAIAVSLMHNDGFQRIRSPVGEAIFFNSFRRAIQRSFKKRRTFIATIGRHHFFK